MSEELIIIYVNIMKVVTTVLVGFPTLWITSNLIAKKLNSKSENHISINNHISIIISKFTFYIGCVLLIVMILSTIGFNVSSLLGAAGIVGAAVGFAATTSVANIISGLFLLIESSFKLGDTIQIGTSTGVAESITLLAIQLRTKDGELIRIPNDLLIKSAVTIKPYQAPH